MGHSPTCSPTIQSYGRSVKPFSAVSEGDRQGKQATGTYLLPMGKNLFSEYCHKFFKSVKGRNESDLSDSRSLQTAESFQ